MSEFTPQDPPAIDDPSVLRAERRLRLLEELAEIGMELARALKPDAEMRAADKATVKDPAEAFAPLSRAIRLTLALEAKTCEELRDLKAGVIQAREEERVRTTERHKAAAAHDAEERERKACNLVIEAAEAEIDDIDAFEAFFEALEERLEEDGAYMDCGGRPLRETVERLCHDLCLTPDWSRWDGEGWAAGYAPIRPPYSPFNQPSPRRLLDDKGELILASPPGRSFPHLE